MINFPSITIPPTTRHNAKEFALAWIAKYGGDLPKRYECMEGNLP
jgi:hypothetical protein